MSRFSGLVALSVCGVLAFVSAPAKAQGQTSPTLFPYLQPWDDVTHTATDASRLNPAPLVATSRVSVRNGHFYDATGRRVRFVGTNVVASANFSDPQVSAKAAAHLHKLGFNCVRLHHMDADWSHPNIFSSDPNFSARQGPTQTLDPQSLDKLDHLVASLKQNGIYVDLNLHVSRSLTPGDGFTSTENLPEIGKVLAYFEPHFIQLQHEYARQILNHVNPYTRQRWADDPVVALVELNNEDSLVGEAFSGKLQSLPPEYKAVLQTRWNEFLAKKYASTTALKTAWSGGQGMGANLITNGDFTQNTDGWQLEDSENIVTAQGLTVENIEPQQNGPAGRALRVSIPKPGSLDWKIQFKQNGLTLNPNQNYTISFWAKSSMPRPASVGVGLDQDPWSNVGGNRHLDLTSTWQHFQVVLSPQNPVDGHNRLSFALGAAAGDVSLADVQIRPGLVLSWDDSKSLEAKNLDLPQIGAATPAQATDWVACLMGIEHQYSDDFRAFLKNEVKYKGLVTCSQASYGALAGVERESHSDWTDMHAYWQHPSFPHRAWDMNDWQIGNSSMLSNADGGTFASLAMHRIQGKPFTVSEYNAPFPNEFAAETVPLIFAYAAWQDWDGVFLFSHIGDRNGWQADKINGFFDVHNDPNKIAFLPSSARLFLSGALAPIEDKKTTLLVSYDSVAALAAKALAAGQGWDGAGTVWKPLGFSRQDITESKVSLHLIDGNAPPRLIHRLNPSRQNGLKWTQIGDKGMLSVDAPTTRLLVGSWANSWAQSGDLVAQCGPASRDFAALSLTSLDGKPINASSSLLLTVLNHAQNTGMTWNETRASVSDWGRAPILVETPAVKVAFPTTLKTAQVWALSPTGKRLQTIPATIKNGVLEFSTDPKNGTVCYEVGVK